MNSELLKIYKRAMLDKVYLSKALKDLRLDPLSKIADIGCGPGGSTEIICECYPKAKIIGVDKSQSAIDYARKMVQKPIEFICADASNIPYGSNKFHCCVARMLFDIADNSDNILRELVRIIRVDGYLLIYSNTRTTAEGYPLPRYTEKMVRAYKRYCRLSKKIVYDSTYISRILQELYSMKVDVIKIKKNVDNPGRAAMYAYYTVPEEEMESFADNNLYVKLNLLKREEAITYERDLRMLLLREDTNLTFEQSIIIAQKRGNCCEK